MMTSLSESSRGILTLLMIAACYTIWTVFHRLMFHPLAKFPGPKLAALTKWYECCYDINLSGGGLFAKRLDELHNAYGPIVRITPAELHIRDPSFYDSLYGSPSSIRDKYPPAAAMAGTSLGTFGTVAHNIHRRRRMAVAQTFQPAAIRALEHLIVSRVERLLLFMKAEQAQTGFIEFKRATLAMTTDVVSSYALGHDLKILENHSRADDWFKTIMAVANATSIIKQFPWLVTVMKSVPRRCVRLVLPDLTRLLDLHENMRNLAKVALERRSGGARTEPKLAYEGFSDNERSSPTIMERILDSSAPQEEKSITRMQHEAVVMISAGSETASRTLTTAVYFVLATPFVLELLRSELEGVSPGPWKLPELRTLESLPWLTAIIKESLRLAAATTSRLPVILPNEDLHYQEWTIPAGTPTSMTIYKTLTDETVYPRPFDFEPQRWLADEPSSEPAHRHFVAFGRGPRACMGMRLAWAQLYLAIAALFGSTALELYDTIRERDVDPVRDCFVGVPCLESKGVRVRIVEDLTILRPPGGPEL